MSIDPTDVITIGDELLRNNPDTFDEDFGENKTHVERLTDIGSKRVRNRVAGYITRKKQRQTQPSR
ncbi:ribosomal protein S17e-like protein [Halalkaliarchaeum desulfuricum]|uniref:Small ribosomal subunit protein eS17 n=1 Tax=Halalkaliarchaeum desulfuricum TaxID=2055893 RepID=A0A343TLY8_9EURY|nr:30S ribosomal protein S17e [Halalkaliarchaeum desulfuricum]AUX10110.1 ribosomal protein S17e-like protein [Halalkaliarchaeum desulfuricum]